MSNKFLFAGGRKENTAIWAAVSLSMGKRDESAELICMY